MRLLKGLGDSFALDIGTSAIRVVQLSKNNSKGWSLLHFGYSLVDEKITASNSPESIKKLGEIIMTTVGQSGIKTKNVVIGLPSNKTFTTVIDVPNVHPNELKSTVKYQLDQYVPIAIDEAKVDWALLGQSMHDDKQQEVLISSTANSFTEERLEFIESLGFNVIAAEPDALAMVRSLISDNINDSVMIVDMGERSTDLSIILGGNPRLVRTIPTGLRTLVKSAAQNLNIQEDQARQFILKFGVAPDRLEGQIYRAIESTLDGFIVEFNKSIKFFQSRYTNNSISNIFLSGFSAVLPKFSEYVSAKTTLQCKIANPWQNIKVIQSDQQQLNATAHEFSTVIGLAQRGNL